MEVLPAPFLRHGQTVGAPPGPREPHENGTSDAKEAEPRSVELVRSATDAEEITENAAVTAVEPLQSATAVVLTTAVSSSSRELEILEEPYVAKVAICCCKAAVV